jgi:ribonuclease R
MINDKIQGTINHKNIDFALVEFEDGGSLKVKSKSLNKALHGDLVEIGIEGKEYFVSKIIQRSIQHKIKGQLKINKNLTFFVPQESNYYTDFFIPTKFYLQGMDDKDYVTVEFLSWGDKDKNPTAKILSIDGNKFTPRIATKFLINEMNLRTDFPNSVIAQVERIEITDDMLIGRKDFRQHLTFTIDPATAKDHDDAISIEKTDKGYRVGIHIADVSAFVTPGTALDIEAFERGCSVYLVDEHIPMLPEKLSSDLCSLIPNVDRLSFSVIYDISNEYKIEGYWVGKTIINSNENISYEEAQAILDDNEHKYHETLSILNDIAEYFTNTRESIDLEAPELEFTLDEQAFPIKIGLKKRLATHKLIEAFMLMANQTVAEILSNYGPGIYRAHPKPSKLQILEMYDSLKKMGLTLNLSEEDIKKSLDELKSNTPEELTSTVRDTILRSLPKAYYTSDVEVGHFGLGFKYYTHFTSPIRRYPDIIAHRLLNCVIEKKQSLITDLESKAVLLSKREKVAQQTERESSSQKMTLFMETINYPISAKIVSIKDWGVFVKTELLSEGLIPIHSLKGKYKDGVMKCPNFTLKVNDYLVVKKERCDLKNRRVYFELLQKKIY